MSLDLFSSPTVREGITVSWVLAVQFWLPNGNPVPLSLVNDFIVCSRRTALKGIEGQWEENAHTALSDLLHERADDRG